MTQSVCILGSTGSVGRQAVQVCRQLGIRVVGLSAGGNARLLAQQALSLCPERVALADPADAPWLRQQLAPAGIGVEAGPGSAAALAALPQADTVLNAVSGFAGLAPTLAALQAGKRLALANKESLVAAGALVMEQARRPGALLLPVDSEHSAIFQCLQGQRAEAVEKLILTASGGPFFGYSRAQLEQVTAQQALRHPNWSMGSKITVDSATMMNKGLELIEAMWLFSVPAERIEIVVHRESVLHSAVAFRDGAVIGQMGAPDMAVPIQYALTWPERPENQSVKRLDFTEYGTLHFARPDLEAFPALGAAIEAARAGGLLPCAVNAANEAAVDLFLQGKITFVQIGQIAWQALEWAPRAPLEELAQVQQADAQLRRQVYCRYGQG